jgi:hypothetical protein
MAEIGQCRDCQHWNPLEEMLGDGECRALSLWDGFYDEMTVLSTVTGHGTSVVTRELFGCVKFEASANG